MNNTKFRKFHFKAFILEALGKQHFHEPTEIQERLIPSILNGSSAIGQSQTGTGKTLAYLLPIIERIDPVMNECQAIITAPTRELADQIYKEFLKFLPEKENGYRVKKIVGGTDRRRMIEKLKNVPHVVIGTPGRISDLVKNNALDIYTAYMLVVDEADQMLDMGFLEEVDYIAARMAEKLQMLVFSATIPEKMQPFLKKYMQNPKFVQIEPKQAAAKEIEHLLLPSRHRDVSKLVVEISKAIHPFLALIFANTKTKADEISSAMLENGCKVETLHGGLAPRERKQAMKRIERLECQYVVATDLASRGIDIKGVSHVINAEMPEDIDFYIHRVGRTGRAGASGTAITIYQQEDESKLRALEKRGIRFCHVDLKNGEWIEMNKRKEHKATIHEPKITLPKPKKIKPGYKKKLKKSQERQHKKRR
ncbi:DEAD/DEAH box helicase [Pueribacillus theae]|uniref:DEAD/DEAH box helicase n=1 Tax=Pueribacillus theae TaxID=2171751 RepID=UPI001F0C37AB|nr:DEAD/DEAH box helicase [Pueribacillus theae]